MLKYQLIQIYTSESARCQGHPATLAIVDAIRGLRIAARCQVSRCQAGCYENGETSSDRMEILSYNAPVKIEIIVPNAEAEKVTNRLMELLPDGIIAVSELNVLSHKADGRLLPSHLLVCDVMSTSPRSVHPETALTEAANILLREKFKALPVVDAQNRPVGMVSQDDLLERGLPLRLDLLALLGPEQWPSALQPLEGKTVGEIMSRPVCVVREHSQLAEAVELMLKRDFKCLPVIDDAGTLCGALARLDIFRVITTHTDDSAKEKERTHAVRKVKEVMRMDMHTVTPNTPLEDVMKVVDANDIRKVAVVSGDNCLLGIISDRDLFGLFHHHVSWWDHLAGRFTFTEMGKRHRDWVKLAGMRTAGELMRKEVVTVNENAAIDEAIKLMTEFKIKQLPVTDTAGRFIGLVGRDTILQLCLR